jgi:hypothetical protein
LWIHVWPNAFKNRKSAFCNQKLRQGNTKFYFAPDTSLGYIKNLDFKVNGQKASWQYDPKNPDIVLLRLETPLAPEGRISVSTPFEERIPASFSRLGHVGTSYQMTQWFPKPAVYDQYGWHPIPYLDQGEFYSEFGSFDVTITLPLNYVVGATGTLETASERAFLEERVAATRAEIANRIANPKPIAEKKKKKGIRITRNNSEGSEDPYPSSSAVTKTIRYTAQRVHDFAWFADKRFFVLKDTARLASGKTVDCWGMFTESDFDLWQKGAFYVKRAVESYSEWVGEYPYPQATAVHSALSAGGGMEYPMITVIGDASDGKSLDNVITHEVGHNWFYGILASNERYHAWMDEGMNSFYENRYMRKFYNSDGLSIDLPKKMLDPQKHGQVLEIALNLTARNGLDQTADQNADHMTSTNYGLQSYMKTARTMYWMEQALGLEVFDRAMKNYYKEWAFKHPYPVDYQASMKRSGVEIPWFMQLMQTTERYDPALRKAQKNSDGSYALTVVQKGQVKGPYSITALKDGQPVKTQWYSHSEASDVSKAPFPAVDADQFVLDFERLTTDVNRINNYRKANSVLRGRPVQVKMFAPLEQANRRTLGVMPWLGFNNYDKLMLGLVLYNPPVPGNAIQYYIAPGYGLGSGDIVGGADIKWRINPVNGAIRRITIGVDGRTFNGDERTYQPTNTSFNTRFTRITPSVRLDFRSGSPTNLSQSVTLRWHAIEEEYLRVGDDGVAGTSNRQSQIQELVYAVNNKKGPNPWRMNATLEHQQFNDLFDRSQQYIRAGLEWNQRIYYNRGKKVNLRGYAGYFIQNTQRGRKSLGFGSDGLVRGSMSLAQNGYTDYKYQQIYLDRSGQDGFLARQVAMSEGGFKYAFGSSEALSAGHTNNFMASINLSADLPKKLPLGLPLKPYFDVGYATLGHVPAGNDEEPSPLFWSGGFALEFFGGNFNVYFPAISSKNLNDVYARTSGGRTFRNYLGRITWSVRLQGLEPRQLIESQLP